MLSTPSGRVPTRRRPSLELRRKDRLKRCPKCSHEKHHSEFNSNKSRRDGLQGYCRPCEHEYKRKWEKDNPDIVRAIGARKKDYHTNWCMEKYNTDPEYKVRVKARMSAYRQSPKGKAKNADQEMRRRARKRGNTAEKFSREDIIVRDNSICHICKKKVPPEEMSLDHLIPIARGGAHTEWNVAVAHNVCNQRRGAGRIPAQLRLHI